MTDELTTLRTQLAASEAREMQLHGFARNAYEVWAGSEGVPIPETAVEAYLIQLVEQVRDEIKPALALPTDTTALREVCLRVAIAVDGAHEFSTISKPIEAIVDEVIGKDE